MDCFPIEIRQEIDRRGAGAQAAEIEKLHTKLLHRRVARIAVTFPDGPNCLSALANAIVLQQTLLRRAERLTVSCGTVLADQNDYGLALLARGILETTAVLGYACSKTAGLTGDEVEIATYYEVIKSLLFGSKDNDDRDNFPEAVNIITCIEQTDKYMSKGPRYGGRPFMRQSYNLLSEYAHPNMLSQSMGIEYADGFVTLVDRPMEPRFCQMALGTVKLCLMLMDDFCDDLTVDLARLHAAAV